VKVRGVRIELGEVEAVLGGHEQVRQVVARVWGRGAEALLVAYVVGQAGGEVHSGELKQWMRERVPEALVPGEIQVLAALPTLSSGKVDRKGLPAPGQDRSQVGSGYLGPRTALEAQLVAIWAQVLGRGEEEVGVQDNFFELGGQSLKAVQLLARVREQLHREITLGTFLQAQTVADLARVLQDDTSPQILLPIRSAAATDPALFLFHPAGGELLIYQTLVAALPPGLAVYGLQSQALIDAGPEAASLELMASAYAAAISQQQGAGPYAFFGWSLGGVLALAVASILERQGQRVKFVGLLDSYLCDEQSDPLADLGLVLGGRLLQAFAALSLQEQDGLRIRLQEIPEPERLEQALDWGKERGLVPAALPVEAVSRQVALVRTHRALLNAYQPPVIEAPVTVWWASQSSQVHPDWGSSTTGGVQEKTVAGDHFAVVQSPTIETIAQEVSTILRWGT